LNFSSILFEKEEENLKSETLEAPAFFVDLNLDQIIDAVTAGRDDYHLKPFFFVPLRDIDAIKYRQEIMLDLENGALQETIRSFSQKMVMMRRYLAMIEKLYYKYNKEGWFLEAVIIYCDAVKGLANDLSKTELKSRGLLAFRDYITSYAGSESFVSLLRETEALKTDLSTVTYCMLIDGGKVQVRSYESEIDYSIEVEKTFEKFKQGAVKDYLSKLPLGSGMNHVEAAVLDLVAKLHPETFSSLDEYCARNAGFLDETIAVFDREIQF